MRAARLVQGESLAVGRQGRESAQKSSGSRIRTAEMSKETYGIEPCVGTDKRAAAVKRGGMSWLLL